MKKYELQFDVSMDDEAKKAGDKHHVKVVVMADDEAIEKYMKKAATVWIQGQIRANWDAFVKGEMPGEVTLDAPIWGNGRGKVTVEKATNTLKAQLSTMTPEEKLAYLKECGLL